MPKQLSALERAKPKSAKIFNACAVAPPLTRLSAVGMIHNTNPINAPADHVLHRRASEPPAEPSAKTWPPISGVFTGSTNGRRHGAPLETGIRLRCQGALHDFDEGPGLKAPIEPRVDHLGALAAPQKTEACARIALPIFQIAAVFP